ncbi:MULTISPECIES: DMT family transporter [Psychromonas]|uniref:DMT family transporter n=1 Tax=Psychromonas TaxID=67572 RepID=UPI0004051230|nr:MULTISPECIES: DMT family transporter [Psychromonas]MBB1271263.1 DMT family transporter [Psychromonas sp. SR45-3]
MINRAAGNNTTNNNRILWMAFLGLLMTNLFWAINAILARSYMPEVAPIAMNLFRWFGVFILLTPFCLPRVIKNWAMIRPHLLALTGLAILSIVFYNSLLYLAANFTTVVNITLINTLIPIATLLMAWRVLGNRPRFMQFLGMVISILGVLLILTKGQLLHLLSLKFSQGDLLMVAAVVVWALFTVLLKKLSLKLSSINVLYILIMLGLPFLMVAYAIEAVFFKFYLPSFEHISLFAYLWVFPSILAYIFWTNGVLRLGAESASLSITLMPLFGAVLAIVFLDESIFWFHIAGGVCSLLGMLFALLPANKLAVLFKFNTQARGMSKS